MKGAIGMKNMNIPVGVSDFAEIRQNGYYYVDKSTLIKELLKTTATKVTLITRPRRFGKTLAMSMLANFSISAEKAIPCLRIWRSRKRRPYVPNGRINGLFFFYPLKILMGFHLKMPWKCSALPCPSSALPMLIWKKVLMSTVPIKKPFSA